MKSMFKRQEQHFEWQLTEKEIEDLRALTTPKILRPILSGSASDINARTQAFRNEIRLLKLQAERDRAVVSALDAHDALAAKEGEIRDADTLRKALTDTKRELTTTVEERDEARRARDRAIAAPAMSVSAQGTGR